MLRKQITVVDVRTLTPPPDKSTLRLDPPQYVSTGNSITLRSTSQDFLSDSWEKGSSPPVLGQQGAHPGSCSRCPAGTGRRSWRGDRCCLMDGRTWQIHNPKPSAAARKLMASRDRRGPRANTCLLHHKLMALNKKVDSFHILPI